jgi:beta-lactamase regulating signal transducer with metallopeptidase domain
VRHAGLEARLAALAADHGDIARSRARIVPVEGDELRTVGVFAARVELGVEAAARLDDASLAAALLHELAHVGGRDPLRIVLAAVCQAINPLSFLLAGELGRWRAGREVRCDEAAVERGADPLALAAALVALARPRAQACAAAAHLGHGGGIALLRLRVSLLLAHRRVTRERRPSALVAAIALLLAMALLPHFVDAWPLVHLHHQAERFVVAPPS